MRVRGEAVFGKGERLRPGQQHAEIQDERGSGIRGEIEVAGEGERGAIRIAGKVVGEATGGLSRSTKAAFEREEDVTALPAPVQTVQVRIERMIGCILRG